MDTLKISKNHWTFKLIAFIFPSLEINNRIRRGMFDTCDYRDWIFMSIFCLVAAAALAATVGFSSTFFLVTTTISLINAGPFFVDSVLFDSTVYQIAYSVGYLTVVLVTSLVLIVLVFLITDRKSPDIKEETHPK